MTLPGCATQIAVFRPPPLVAEASPEHPVLAGGIAATARGRAQRAELLAMVAPGPAPVANQAATARLAAALRAAFPALAIDAEPSSYVRPDGLRIIDSVTPGGTVRIAVPGPLDDSGLRAIVDRARGAIDAIPFDSGVPSPHITDVALGFSSCAAFYGAADADAAGWISGLARYLGDPHPAGASLADRTARPANGHLDPLCGDDAHASVSPLQRSLVPTTATASEQRAYAFAMPLRIPITAERAQPLLVPDTAVAYAPWSDVDLRVTSPDPVLTVDGFARAGVRYVEGRYVWTGPNAAHRRDDLRHGDDTAIRARLAALGIRDDAIVTQLDPIDGERFVEVRTADASPRDAIVDAIAGGSALERHEVRFLRDRDDCRPQARDVASAVADAAMRARAVASALGTTADVGHPVAIDLLSRIVEPCTTRDTPPYDDRIERHVAGALRVPDANGTITVTVSFTLGKVALPVENDASLESLAGIDDDVVRFQLAPPAVVYPAAATSGEARVQTSLPATAFLVRTRFDVNDRARDAPLDENVPRAFADRLGAGAASFSLALAAVRGGSAEHPAQEWRSLIALDASPASLAAIIAADRAANEGANVQTEVLQQRESCGAAPLALAVRAIREAASAARRSAPSGRLVAVDLSGPYAVSGRCDRATSFAQWRGARASSAMVRLAAYARVSYAR